MTAKERKLLVFEYLLAEVSLKEAVRTLEAGGSLREETDWFNMLFEYGRKLYYVWPQVPERLGVAAREFSDLRGD